MKGTAPVLVINRSFHPDMEATGQFLTQLCEDLSSHFPIEVISGYPNFKAGDSTRVPAFEDYRGIRIFRVRHTRFWKGRAAGRITNWMTFTLTALLKALARKPAAVVIATDPPLMILLAPVLRRWYRAPIIYNPRDLYLEASLAAGKLRPGLISRAFEALHRAAIRNCARVVALGESTAQRFRQKGVPEPKISVIPDWADTRLLHPVPRGENRFLASNDFRGKWLLMYSGNMGFMQDLHKVIALMAKLKDLPRVHLLMIGDGANKADLEAQAAALDLQNVTFLPYQPFDTLSHSLGAANLHLIPMKKGVAGAIVPSKVYGIMAVGRPFVVVGDRESEPARIATQYRCGLWVDPDDSESFVRTVRWAMDHPEECDAMGQRGRETVEREYQRTKVSQCWREIIEDTLRLSRSSEARSVPSPN